MGYERRIIASLNKTRGCQAMYEYNYVDPVFLGDGEFGAVYYDLCIIEGENEWLESRCVWMIPAAEYPPL